MSTAVFTDPTLQITHALDARGWDLHVEQAGRPRFARVSAGEDRPPLWVATVTRGDLVLEADGETARQALDRLWVEIQRHCRRPPHMREARG